MGLFDNFKINFGFGGSTHNEDSFGHPHHGRGHHHRNGPDHHEIEMVREGYGVFAWIEKSGLSYRGDIPGVSGIMSVHMADGFDDCLDKLRENINNSISVSFSSFRQDVSYEEIMKDHPDAEIVFIPIYKR